jgi:hypothetical protein
VKFSQDSPDSDEIQAINTTHTSLPQIGYSARRLLDARHCCRALFHHRLPINATQEIQLFSISLIVIIHQYYHYEVDFIVSPAFRRKW